MKRAIVTGANGFVGSAVINTLCQNHVHVIALDMADCNDNISNSPDIKFISCELSEMSMLSETLKAYDADTFYHFAWAGSAGDARTDTVLQLKNVQWTVDALRLAKSVGCTRFVCAGSIMEDETIDAVYTQGNKPGLGYIYGCAKVAAHMLCMSVAADIGIDLIWTKITNAYGPGEKSPRLINSTIRKVLRNESPRFTAGTQHYDFVYIDDVARAFYLIGENGKPFHEYLIGSGTARALKEFLSEMQSSISPNLEFVFGDIPFTGIDLPLKKFDCARTEEDTGFKAEVSFAQGTIKTMEWLKEN